MCGRFLSVMAAALLTGCASLTTHYDYDTTAAFGALEAYDWLPVDSTTRAQINDINVRRIQGATNRVLAEKGYRVVSDNPDFLVAIHAGTQEKLDLVSSGYRYGPYGRWYGGYRGGIDVYRYTEGTLVIDVVDASSKQLIWRGSAQGTVNPGMAPEEIEHRIDEAVAKILERFPPT